MVKALDLSSNGRMSAWVRSPLLVNEDFRHIGHKICEICPTVVETQKATHVRGRVDRAFYSSQDGRNRMWVQTPLVSNAIFDIFGIKCENLIRKHWENESAQLFAPGWPSG